MASILDPTQPLSGGSAGRGDDELRALKQFFVDVFGFPVSPNQIISPIGSTATNGTFTFASPPGGQRSLPGMVGLAALNNVAVSPAMVDMSAKYLAVKRPSDESVIGLRSNPGCSVDTALAGPVPNGRDQLAAFPVSVFLHFYWIYNPSTDAIAGTVSLNPSAPILPTGYTHFVYATTILKDGSGNLVRFYQRGNWVWFAVPSVLISNGTATAETFLNYGGFVPDQSVNIMLESRILATGVSVTGIDELWIGVVGGSVLLHGPVILSSSIVQLATAHMQMMIPNTGSGGLYYRIFKNSTSTVTVAISVLGYQVPNGDG